MSGYGLAAPLMIASGSIHAVVNAIVKGGRDKMAGRAVTDGSSALLLLPTLPFVAWPGGAWHWLALSAVIHMAYLYALIRTYALADLSACYPILRGTAPLVTATITIGVLGDSASVAQIAGIALIGGAMFGMLAGRHIGWAALGWSLLTGVTIASYTVVDAYGVRAAPDPMSYIAWQFVIAGFCIVAMFALVSKGAMFAAAARQWQPGLVAGVLSIATYGIALYALSIGPTAPLAALRETGMVTALILATVFLKERVTRGRLAGVLGILCGAALLLAG